MSDEIHADLAVAEHREAVDVRLRAATERGHRAWARVLVASDGADPRLVAQRIQALGLPVHGWTVGAEREPEDPWQPELHARDFEWYFTPTCAADLAMRVSGPDRSVLCMGTPTVAFALLEHPALRRVTLVDRNPLALRRHRGGEALEAIDEAIETARLDAGAYDAVVLDAPWYPDALQRWLGAAVAAVRPGGCVLFALMRSLHRPSALRDRASILSLAGQLGEVEVEPGRLCYDSPRFEREALAAAGVHVPAAWRRADLVRIVVRDPSACILAAPAPPSTPAEPAWLRFVVGSQVIQLDPHAEDGPGDPLSPVSAAPDYRYTSISTRDPRRSEIGLWTSRSRVARVRRPGLVAALLQRLAREGEHRGLWTAPELSTLPEGPRTRVLDALATIVGPPTRTGTRSGPTHG
ncbi:hypothetical protein [Paraliomyxa miuraensis]|uniref:hypothetical protein n=1 Tax=Paraliomyxa miuraensis TaxID=376150 RepID=UPI002254C6BB|nr:hypothetical protein [Paraliomyxa miuraensis]MCX4239688.1 class I SAM-dependent methyltransferase [Paraliomyxa miuraensis]